jgi:hypothetical protein
MSIKDAEKMDVLLNVELGDVSIFHTDSPSLHARGGVLEEVIFPSKSFLLSIRFT